MPAGDSGLGLTCIDIRKANAGSRRVETAQECNHSIKNRVRARLVPLILN